MSSGSAAVSRSVDGPSSGSTRYGPLPTPQVASVCPKSSLRRSRPASVATSSTPPRPNTEFVASRIAMVRPFSSLPWRSWLAADQPSPRLPKKLPTPLRNGSGATSR